MSSRDITMTADTHHNLPKVNMRLTVSVSLPRTSLASVFLPRPALGLNAEPMASPHFTDGRLRLGWTKAKILWMQERVGGARSLSRWVLWQDSGSSRGAIAKWPSPETNSFFHCQISCLPSRRLVPTQHPQRHLGTQAVAIETLSAAQVSGTGSGLCACVASPLLGYARLSDSRPS